jgi:hypothetical protein
MTSANRPLRTNTNPTPAQAQLRLENAFDNAWDHDYRVIRTGVTEQLERMDITAYEAATAILAHHTATARRENYDYQRLRESHRLADSIHQQTQRRR